MPTTPLGLRILFDRIVDFLAIASPPQTQTRFAYKLLRSFSKWRYDAIRPPCHGLSLQRKRPPAIWLVILTWCLRADLSLRTMRAAAPKCLSLLPRIPNLEAAVAAATL